MSNEDLGGRDSVLLGTQVQRRETVERPTVDGCTALQQQSYHVSVTLDSRQVESREAILSQPARPHYTA